MIVAARDKALAIGYLRRYTCEMTFFGLSENTQTNLIMNLTSGQVLLKAIRVS
jgi:hypothetical protein